MKSFSDDKVTQVFKMLGIENEEDRLELLERFASEPTDLSELLGEDYYTIHTSANSN